MDTAGSDVRLLTNSPCIDAGTNAAWMAAGLDLEGYPRVIRGTVDIGAYETTSTHYFSPVGGHVWPFLTWQDAATNLQSAIDAAHPSDAILLTNGVYSFPSQIVVASGVTLRSINGPAASVIDGNWSTRCVYLAHSNAVIDGFTIRYGAAASGAGVYVAQGTVRNCLIATNQATGKGGGVYLQTNAVLRNCLVVGNMGGDGGGVLVSPGTTVENCTIVNNEAMSSGGGIRTEVGGTIRNSIMWYNSAPSGSNIYNVSFGWTYQMCSTSSNGIGLGVVTNPPRFEDYAAGGFRLTTNSPCYNTGTNIAWVFGDLDLDGYPRLNGTRVDMGAFELSAHHYAWAGGSNVWPYATWATAATNIQDAVNAAAVDDFVVLTNAVYDCGSVLVTQRVTITGVPTASGVSTVTGGGRTRCFVLTTNATLEGLTLTGGYAADHGGAVMISGGGILRACVLEGNRAGQRGGAAFINGAGLIDHCTLRYNVAASNDGGAAYLSAGGMLINSFLSTNSARKGGAAFCEGPGIVRGCIVVGNQATNQPVGDPDFGYAGGILVEQDGGVIENCTVVGNHAAVEGGGVTALAGTLVQNCIIWNNTAPLNPNRQALAGSTFSNNCTTPVIGIGGTDNDPRFRGAGTGDYRITTESPCLHAGVNGAWMADAEDIHGNPRLVGHSVDIGAAEIAFVYVSAAGSHQAPYLDWSTAANDVESALRVARNDWIVLVTNGTYFPTNEIRITNAIALRSVNGPRQTTITGNGVRRCITLATNATVDGFTITGGRNHFGAGVRFDAAGLVENCIITGNSVTTNGGGVAFMANGTLRNCIVTSNTASQYGGGIYLDRTGTVESCTIAGNTAYYGGGVYGVMGGLIRDSIIFTNLVIGPTTGRENYYMQGGGMVITNSCTFPAVSTPQVCFNVITNDPRFASASTRDYRLTNGSPCIDRLSNGPAADLDAIPRPLSGGTTNSTLWDMGALEFLSPRTDLDGNGLSDAWEFTHFGGTSLALPDGDDDGDGIANFRESVADTDPHNAASFFAIATLEAANGMSVAFQSSAERVYTLQYRTNMTSGAWINVQAATPGLGSGMTLSDPSTAPLRFYRVRVDLP